jgi:hypothetical protein
MASEMPNAIVSLSSLGGSQLIAKYGISENSSANTNLRPDFQTLANARLIQMGKLV